MADLSEHADSVVPGDPDDPGAAPRAVEADEPGASEVPDESSLTLEDLLGCLRRCAAACEPPVGVGSFDMLYASSREVVVWYSPARPEHHPGEVAIPTARLSAAWSLLASGAALDESALEQLGQGTAGGRWLLAVLAQVPGVRVRVEPSLALEWSPPVPEPSSQEETAEQGTTAEADAMPAAAPRRRRKRNV